MKPQSLPSPTCPVLLEKIVTSLYPQQPDLQIGDLNSVELVPLITLEKLKSVCSRMGIKKAPGPDGQMALRVTSAFRTVSRDAAHVISGLLPIEIVAKEQRRIYQHRSQMTVGKEKDRKVFKAGRHSGTAPKRADGPTSSSRG